MSEARAAVLHDPPPAESPLQIESDLHDWDRYPISLTVAQAAAILGVSESTIYRSLGDIPHRVVGRRVVIPRDALRYWLDQAGPEACGRIAIRPAGPSCGPDSPGRGAGGPDWAPRPHIQAEVRELVRQGAERDRKKATKGGAQ